MKYKLPIMISAFLLGVLIFGIGSMKSISLITSANANEQRTVIIDAGHGGLTNTIMAIFFETVQPHCFGAKS